MMNRFLCLLALCVLVISRIEAGRGKRAIAGDHNSQDISFADQQAYEYEGSADGGADAGADYSGDGSYSYAGIPGVDDEGSQEGSADGAYGDIDKMTKCEREYQYNKMRGDRRDEPQCTKTGAYAAKQCDPSTAECWCVNYAGQEIPGTISRPPWTPDCDKVDRTRTYPKPVVEEPIIKSDKGQNVGNAPTDPNTDISIEKEETDVVKTGPKNGGVSVDTIDDPDSEPSHEEEDEDNHHDTTKEQLSRDSGLLRQPLMLAVEVETLSPPVDRVNQFEESTPNRLETASIFSKPGILAGLIAIAVVCLLCAVLLVMFIVYRMRKKDEGSYALEEPKRSQSHPYQRAPTKEFFA